MDKSADMGALSRAEKRVAAYFARHGLEVGLFTKTEKRQSRTPDFRVFKGGELAFYCEVKNMEEDRWLIDQARRAPPGTLVGGLRNDPTYNRLSNYVHEAAQQFDAVNPETRYPNVLAIVSDDPDYDDSELLAVLTGNAYTPSGSIRIFGKFSDGRIRDQKWRIHLYLWFDPSEPEPRGWLSEAHAEHHAALCSYFGVEPAHIGQPPGPSPRYRRKGRTASG